MVRVYLPANVTREEWNCLGAGLALAVREKAYFGFDDMGQYVDIPQGSQEVWEEAIRLFFQPGEPDAGTEAARQR